MEGCWMNCGKVQAHTGGRKASQRWRHRRIQDEKQEGGENEGGWRHSREEEVPTGARARVRRCRDGRKIYAQGDAKEPPYMLSGCEYLLVPFNGSCKDLRPGEPGGYSFTSHVKNLLHINLM